MANSHLMIRANKSFFFSFKGQRLIKIINNLSVTSFIIFLVNFLVHFFKSHFETRAVKLMAGYFEFEAQSTSK